MNAWTYNADTGTGQGNNGARMSDLGKPLRPEQIFKRVIWRSTLGVGVAMEQFTTWTITGIAAIVALFVANLDAVSAIASLEGIRWSLILFSVSILAGALSKQFGMAVQSGIKTMSEMQALLSSDAGQELMDGMETEPRQLIDEIAAAFVWPLNRMYRNAGQRGLREYLAGDKTMVRFFCYQLYLNLFHGIIALLALVILACSIKT